MKKTIAQELNITQFPFEIRDSKGNLIYYERKDGYWARWKRNDYGSTIFYENSDNFWERWEYNSEGKEIYYKNSEGKIHDWRTNTEPLQVSDNDYKRLMKALYPKDRSKNFSQ